MRIEEERLDIMQNLEFAVARFYRQHAEMTDFAVLQTYETLLQVYSAEITGRSPKPVAADRLEAELLRDVKQMCEWRVGRWGEAPWRLPTMKSQRVSPLMCPRSFCVSRGLSNR